MRKKHTKLYEWQQRAKNEDLPCAKCGRIGAMTLDHIIPVGLLDSMGIKEGSYDDDWNYQYLCRACNHLKHAKVDWSDPRTAVNLKRYVDIAVEYFKV